MSEIKEQSVQLFLDRMASKAATPGGGSAAAVMGAQAAALISMVCNLTLGKAGYENVADEMTSMLQRSEALREELTGMIKADVEVFDKVMAAYGMPKQDDAQKAARSTAIQEALKEATDVPLQCAQACCRVLYLSREAAEKGNVNVVTDAGVAVMSAYAALKSAALNVYINIGSLKDKEFAEERKQRLEHLLQGADVACNEIYLQVKNKL